MRKFFALALAVAMVLSLASVSFAADYPESDIVLSPFYKYSGDSDKIDTATQAHYGKSYYALIFEGKGTFANGPSADATKLDNTDTWTVNYAPISKYESVEKLKVKAEFEMGEDLVESVSIVKKSFKTTGGAYINAADTTLKTGVVSTYDGTEWSAFTGGTPISAIDPNGYFYCVEIKTKETLSTSEGDIIGTLEFNRKANTKKDIAKIDDCEVDFSLNLFYEHNYNKADGDGNKFVFDGTTSTLELKWDDLYLVKFDNDDEVEFEFGKSDLNEGLFTVDASGQGKMIINFNTKANEAICAANEGAKMFFVNFNGAKFNRVGTFEYEMENMVAAYEVVGDKLVEIKGLELDGEVATFNTRTLGNYVFADAELVNPAAAVEAPVVEAPAAVTNPSTGA